MKDLYDKSYQKFTPEVILNKKLMQRLLAENSSSLRDFLAKLKILPLFEKHLVNLTGKKVLVSGSGHGAIAAYLAKLGAQVTAVDVSPLAISQAKELHHDQGIQWVAQDINDHLESAGEYDLIYDLIIDDHLFHCLTDKGQRARYVKNCLNSLSPEGLFIGESLAWHEQCSFPYNFTLDENSVLSQLIEGEYIPVRLMASSRELEEELSSMGSLKYFTYHSELSFDFQLEEVPEKEQKLSRREIFNKSEINPHLVRFVLAK